MQNQKAKRSCQSRFANAMIIAATALLANLWAPSPGLTQAPEAGPVSQNEPHYTETGVEACLYCHSVDRMRLILDTRHGDAKNPDTPMAQHGCESCHGPGSLHATRSRRGKGRPPMFSYGEKGKTPPGKQAKRCLENCHDKTLGTLPGMEWEGSAHGRVWTDVDGNQKQMSCSNCHEIHIHTEPLKEKEQQAVICYRCHQKTEAEHPRFEEKGIDFDKLECWDCHDVHQLIPSQDVDQLIPSHLIPSELIPSKE